MRQIGTLSDGDAARTLADYLLTLKIATRLEQQPAGWIVWVCDEDRVDQARQEFASFTLNPADRRFAGVSRAADELRLREIEADEDYVQRLADFRERMRVKSPNPLYVTYLLLVAAVFVTLLTNFGDREKNAFAPHLWISSEKGPQLAQIAHGEVWRLFTPIFIHGEWMHLVFNCCAVLYLGGQVERSQGSLRLVWLVFLFALFSNVAQFYLGHPRWDPQFGFVLLRNAHFGGLSGVAYGLFGYVWMKSRFAPELGMGTTPGTVVLMLVWLFACLTGVMGAIANTAHFAGFILGLAIGGGPHWWQRLRQL